MSTNEKSKNVAVEGPPWRIEKRCATFEEADNIRKLLLEEEKDLQVKVHWMRSAQTRVFAVKIRTDPTAVPRAVSRKKKKRKKR